MQEFRVRDWRIWSPEARAGGGSPHCATHRGSVLCGLKILEPLGVIFLCVCVSPHVVLSVNFLKSLRVSDSSRQNERALTCHARTTWPHTCCATPPAGLALPVFVRRFLLFQPRSAHIPDSRDRQGNPSPSRRPAEAH